MSAAAYLIDDEADKKEESSLSMMKVAILAVLLFLLSVMSVICYTKSLIFLRSLKSGRSICHTRENGYPEKRKLDSRLRGNDTVVTVYGAFVYGL